MRGLDATSGSLFSYVDLEGRVPAKDPLRVIRGIVNGSVPIQCRPVRPPSASIDNLS